MVLLENNIKTIDEFSSLDTGINYKEFKNLSNDDKKGFFDLSKMNNI